MQFSDLKSQNPEHYVQVLKRMGNIRNEIGVFYMNQAAALQGERVGECLLWPSLHSWLYWRISCTVCGWGKELAPEDVESQCSLLRILRNKTRKNIAPWDSFFPVSLYFQIRSRLDS